MSFFYIVARAPPARRVGNARGSIPQWRSRGNAGRLNPQWQWCGSTPSCSKIVDAEPAANPDLAQSENRSRRGWQTRPSPKVKIVRAPKHYSAAHIASLLRHPHGGNTRSRTKPQSQTPKTNTNCAIPLVAIHVRAPKPKLTHPEPTPAAPSILARYPPGAT